MYEQRLTVRLTDYWNTLRKDAPMPNFAQFNQGAVGDLWPNCLVFAAQPTAAGKVAFRVQAVGDNLTQLFGHDLVGREATKPALRVFGGGKIAGDVEQTALARAPVEAEGKYVNDKNKVVKYRACLLPFSTSPDSVSHILAGLSWREF